ncbi:hypothetical protein [Streptomyces sp. NPDC053560]|uniref:hypothetical protein n=1 Tax=Streptomyces sp. NPDC053560 TaxID=3365711 RepID=UPI0037D7F864
MNRTPPSAEERLRSALLGVAETVEQSPDAYRHARRHWRRKEWRRRAVLAAVVLLLAVLACAVGLWALSGAASDGHVIFGGEVTREVSTGLP